MEAQKLEAAFRASNLITAYLQDTLTTQQEQQLNDWLDLHKDNRLLFETLTSPPLLHEQLTDFSTRDKRKKAALKRLRRRLFPHNGKVRRLTARLWRYVA